MGSRFTGHERSYPRSGGVRLSEVRAPTSRETIDARPVATLNPCRCGGMRQVVRIFPERRKATEPIAWERRQN